MIKSTDQHIIETIKSENQEILDIAIRIDHKNVNLKSAKCKELYWSEISKKGQRPTSYFKWESEYYYATFEWDEINIIPYKCCRETSLQSLQYQIIHRFYPCRYNLNLWQKEPDNKCKTCGEIDSLQHYFVECTTVALFWKYLKTWCRFNFDFAIAFGPLDILLGIPNHDENNELNILNFIIIFGKSYIKACKNKEKPLEFYNFQVCLKERMNIEERIHISNHNEIKFENKWSKLMDSL